MDKELFELAVQAAERIEIPDSGIGTKAEFKIHASLKYYLQPDMELHEQKRDGYICDAVNDDGIIEIQTAGFKNLRPKLENFLPKGIVTVVYPIVESIMIITKNSESGAVTRRRSPKKMGAYNVFRELCSISDYVSHPNFRLRMITLSAEEYRIKYPEKRIIRRGKRPRNYEKLQKIPTGISGDVVIASPDEYRMFLPDGLPMQFFSSDVARHGHISPREATALLKFLTDIGIVERIARSKAGYLYEINEK